MSLRLQALRLWLRHVEKPRLARIAPGEARRRFEAQARLFRDPPLALYLDDAIGGVPVTWAGARPGRPGVLFWVHGGAHVMGSPLTHRALAARIAARAGIRACLPDYRLAPEHPFPAGLTDLRRAWDGLVARGYRPGSIVLGGDSSGGGMMLSLLAGLLAEGQRPSAAVALAPFTDLTGGSTSWTENAAADPFLPAARLREVVDLYLQHADPADPAVSPLYARFPDCPPVFFQVANTEILRDDSLRMAEHLRQQGAEVELDLWDDCPHVWPMFQGWLPEADEAVRRIAGFVRKRLPAPPPGES